MPTQPNKNLVELLAPYMEDRLWVALNEERTEVMGWGKTAKEALQKAKEKNAETPFLLRAIPDYSNFILG